MSTSALIPVSTCSSGTTEGKVSVKDISLNSNKIVLFRRFLPLKGLSRWYMGPTLKRERSWNTRFSRLRRSRRPREGDTDTSFLKRPRSEIEVASTTCACCPVHSASSALYLYAVCKSHCRRCGQLLASKLDTARRRYKFEPLSAQWREYHIALFHELRYWNSNKTSHKTKVPEWQALCQCCKVYVENFNKDPQGYRARLVAARERLHNDAEGEGISCAVPVGINCLHYPIGAARMSDADIKRYTYGRVPDQLKVLSASLEDALESSRVANNHNGRRGVTHETVVGVARLHHFWMVRHQDVERGPYRLVSNEYENEPDLSSSSDLYGPYQIHTPVDQASRSMRLVRNRHVPGLSILLLPFPPVGTLLRSQSATFDALKQERSLL
ncbi:Hypothetical protein PHPALM_17014 [Phytophthora palmivora]|uniref:Uncharacterized protein n=1 Tax=Phytophthora palmivora TaxID=4796 RepID=A0A2P4XNC7_9STRA|nr:Hypothetical protein PHPALM_17014 [Phytophthora palmivora]